MDDKQISFMRKHIQGVKSNVQCLAYAYKEDACLTGKLKIIFNICNEVILELTNRPSMTRRRLLYDKFVETCITSKDSSSLPVHALIEPITSDNCEKFKQICIIILEKLAQFAKEPDFIKLIEYLNKVIANPLDTSIVRENIFPRLLYLCKDNEIDSSFLSEEREVVCIRYNSICNLKQLSDEITQFYQDLEPLPTYEDLITELNNIKNENKKLKYSVESKDSQYNVILNAKNKFQNKYYEKKCETIDLNDKLGRFLEHLLSLSCPVDDHNSNQLNARVINSLIYPEWQT